MIERQVSGWRTLVGFALAIVVAPVTTALCFAVAFLASQVRSGGGLSDEMGGMLTFLVIALVFGGVLAILPVLLLGSIVITVSRLLDARSPTFHAAAGVLAGACVALLDAARMGSGFSWLETAPFLIGGCASALSYWVVAER